MLIGDLNMLRSFAGTGIPTVVVSRNPRDVTFRSRHCHERAVIPDAGSDPDGVLEALVRVSASAGDRPVLYYGDDAMLLWISRNRDVLAKSYRFLMPPQELVEACVDKTRFLELARRRRLPVPEAVTAAPGGTAGAVLSRIRLPCVVKPGTGIGWFRSEAVRRLGGKPQKILLARTPSELEGILASLADTGETYLVQEFVPGGEERIYSYHAYRNLAGEVLGSYVGKKIRTYPAVGGVSTFVELVHQPRVEAVGREILDALEVVGVVKIDFKEDPRNGRFRLLELNLRFNLWNHLGTASGVNLPLIAYLDNCGLACPPAPRWRTDVRWLSFGDDLRAMVRDYRPAGLVSWRQWALSLRGRKVYEIFAWNDPWPLVVHLVRYGRLVGTKLVRRLRP